MITRDLESQKTFNPTLTYVTLVGAFFGFGSFGFLNLFGIRVLFQLGLCLLLLLLILSIVDEVKLKTQTIIVSGVLVLTFIVAHLIQNVDLVYFLQLLLALLLMVFVDRVSPHNLRKACCLIGTISFWLCLLVIIGWIAYAIPYIKTGTPNILIYHSNIGTSSIEPHNWVDWITFTTGDGYTLFNQSVFRMKGYSNEPSATVVHYFAPVVFLLFLKRNYLLPVMIVLLANLIAIASVTTIMIVLISIAIFIVRKISRQLSGLMVSLLLLTMAWLIYHPEVALIGLEYLSRPVTSSYDLFAKKLESGMENSSFAVRVNGIAKTTDLVFSNPFGFSNDRLHVAAGVLFIIAAAGGWLALIALIPVISNCYRAFLFKLTSPNIPNHQIAAYSILISLLFNACVTSGYGWDRVPGLLFVLLSLKLIKVLSEETLGSTGFGERVSPPKAF